MERSQMKLNMGLVKVTLVFAEFVAGIIFFLLL
jgi:hypothetical protein